MITNLAAVLVLALAVNAEPAAQPPSPPPSAVATMDAKIKQDRIDKATKDIAAKTKELSKIVDPKTDQEKATKSALLESIRALSIERKWLKGELTPSATAAAVVVAKDELAKAKEAGKATDGEEKKLARATAENDEIKKLEAAEKPAKPKDAEPD